MGRVAAWYTVEVERLLKGRLPGAELAETLGEVETHLAESSDDLAQTCLHGEDPDELAVERFGSPRRVALQILDAQGRLAYWQTGKPLAAWFGAAAVFGVASVGMQVGGGPFALLEIALFSSLVGFACVGFKSRRLQTKAVTCAAVLLLVATSLVLPFAFTFADGGLLPTRRLPDRLSDLQALSSRNDRELAWLDKGVAAFATGDPAAVPKEYRTAGGYYSLRYAPYRVTDDEGVVVRIDTGPVSLSRAAAEPELPAANAAGGVYVAAPTMKSSYADARSWWLRGAPELRDELQTWRLALPGRIAGLERAVASDSLGRWLRDLPVAAYAAWIVWLIAMGIHAASVCLGRMWLAGGLLWRQYA